MQPRAVYRGVIITNSNNGYNAFGNTYQSLRLAKEAVDSAYYIIADSIKKASTGIELHEVK